jgi:predicted acylesterase/phospholipase RssA/CRP-like cAMP-binding protein
MRATSPLFAGLPDAVLDGVLGQMQRRRFAAGEAICRQGEQGDSLFVIERGVAQIVVSGHNGPQTIARMRRGDVLGELSLLSNEPRSATVVASVPCETLELGRDAFTALLSRYPTLLANLSAILGQRLAQRTTPRRNRGEAVALVCESETVAAAEIVEATEAAAAVSVATLAVNPGGVPADFALVEHSVEGALSALDELLNRHGLVVIVADLLDPELPLLLAQVDRTLVVVDSAPAERALLRLKQVSDGIEVALVEQNGERARAEVAGRPVVRTIRRQHAARDIAWLGRHLARTKLGLALGAGGAKGYAHVGALYVLEEAGYTVDYVAGSSIGAMVGAWLGLGMTAAEIDATMRERFTPQNVSEMFKLSLSGMSTGLDLHTRTCRESTADKTFDDLEVPLVAMAVDLNRRRPAPITSGPLWQAMLASTALAGMFPPYELDGQRLVDGIALVPVPSEAVREAGADVVVSINLAPAETLAAWPGQSAPEAKAKRPGSRMLDTLLEVMDLSQLEAGIRHAGLADVQITPLFGPASWRDFELADLFLAAGRSAAQAQLAELAKWARPQSRTMAL